ncbi:MAG: SsrA-binding protein SmpB [Candidatus Omnitrophica bacterium]|nr:SsrA-binding protein SmpB [Candidatus Omnitrophota bacterium]MBU1809401.1 SsrA-binding protein SmpB [Candidatus Omnitrophota bacterium]
MPDKTIVTNRQARFNYTILESLEAGIALTGTEVKSLRSGNVSLNESFARIDGREIFIYNMHIAPYEFGNINNPDSMRPRKLLLHRAQIRKFAHETSIKHLVLIPLKLYFKDGLAKVEIALAKGKKLYDKRESIKKRDSDREIKRRLAE